MNKVCFITKSDKFDKLFSSFRIAGIDTYKKDASADISEYDVLIVDLGHPLEQAYTLLEKIKNDFKLSKTIIIASITHRSQLAKLRSFALGCDSYIGLDISPKDLINKIKQLSEPDKHLLKKSFDGIQVEVELNANLSHISENGCLIKSKVSLDQIEDKIKIKSKLIDELNLSNKMLFSISKSNPISRRSFISEIHFLNISDNERQDIRKMIHNWSAE